MIVENHYPADIRVRKEAEVLQDIYDVSVIALRRKGERLRETVNDVNVYRIPPPKLLPLGKIRYVLDYILITLGGLFVFLMTFPFRRYRVIHAHNPPDTLFVIGLVGRLLGVRFIYDLHDLSPELYLSRFGGMKDSFYRVLLTFERWSCRLANVVITANSTYRDLVVDRHNIDPSKVFVVRNDPSPEAFRAEEPPKEKLDDKFALIFLGMVNPQDGMDVMCEIMKTIVIDMERTDIVCRVLGHGDSLEEVKQYALKLGVGEYFDFHGFVRDKEEVRRLLSSSHIGVEPAPDNPLNRKSTFIKIMEYMASCRPIVAFDLPETRYSADGAALLVRPGDNRSFAEAVVQLMDDPQLRLELGTAGLKRIKENLNWDNSAKLLNTAYLSVRSSG